MGEEWDVSREPGGGRQIPNSPPQPQGALVHVVRDSSLVLTLPPPPPPAPLSAAPVTPPLVSPGRSHPGEECALLAHPCHGNGTPPPPRTAAAGPGPEGGEKRGSGRLPAPRTHLDCPGCHSNRGRFEVRSRKVAQGSPLGPAPLRAARRGPRLLAEAAAHPPPPRATSRTKSREGSRGFPASTHREPREHRRPEDPESLKPEEGSPVRVRPPPPAEPEGGRWQQEAGKGPGGAQAPQWSGDYRDLSLPPPAPTLIKSFFPLLESPRALSTGVGATAGSCRQPHEKGGLRGEEGAPTPAWTNSNVEGPLPGASWGRTNLGGAVPGCR